MSSAKYPGEYEEAAAKELHPRIFEPPCQQADAYGGEAYRHDGSDISRLIHQRGAGKGLQPTAAIDDDEIGQRGCNDCSFGHTDAAVSEWNSLRIDEDRQHDADDKSQTSLYPRLKKTQRRRRHDRNPK